MTIQKPLSISAYNEYVECGRKYELSRIKRIRPRRSPSFFMTGSVVDAGLNIILTGGTREQALKACDEALAKMLTEQVQFFEIDYDGECIDSEIREQLLKTCQELGYKGDNIDELAASLMEKQGTLSEKQEKALATLCHASLRAKTVLMVDAYIEKILPNLTEVSDVQKELRWTDSKGNEFIGVLDFTATVNGVEATCDNKTSSRPYENDSVRTSSQFAAYAPQTGRKYAAHLVMEKAIRKNRIKTCTTCHTVATGRHKTCAEPLPMSMRLNDGKEMRCNGEFAETIQPEANVQIIVDEVSEAEQVITQKALTDVAEAVKAGVYPRNLKSCEQKFGKRKSRCPYYDYCRSGDMTGLAVKEPSEKPK